MHPVTKSFTAAFFVAGTLDFHGTSSNYLLYSSVESIKTGGLINTSLYVA